LDRPLRSIDHHEAPWPLLVLGTLCGAFVFRQFYGTIIAGIAADIMTDLRLSPDALGRVVGLHLLVFAVMQLPVGILFDRFGPRRVMASLLVVVALGSFLFATASSALGLAIAYGVVGAGFSGTLMGTLLVLSQTFPVSRLATYSSLVLASGGLGTMLSSTPAVLAADWVGWRTVFLAMGGATLAIAALIFTILDDADRRDSASGTRQSLYDLVTGLRTVWMTPGLLGLVALSLLSFSTLSIMRGVWAGPYLHDVYGLPDVAVGNGLLAMSVAIVAGTLAYGPLDRLVRSRKRVVIAGATSCAAIMLLLAVLDRPTDSTVVILLVALGMFGTYDVVLLAHARSLFDLPTAGRGMTTVNVAAFAGAAGLQALTGFLISELPTRFGLDLNDAYRIMFGIIGIAIIVVVSVYARVPDVSPADG